MTTKIPRPANATPRPTLMNATRLSEFSLSIADPQSAPE